MLRDDQLARRLPQSVECGFVFLFQLIRRIEEYDIGERALEYGQRFAGVNFGAILQAEGRKARRLRRLEQQAEAESGPPPTVG